MNGVVPRARRWIKAGLRTLRFGRTMVWTTRRYVFKVAVHPLAVRQLGREVTWARQATGWSGYGALVIEPRRWTPFVAVSAYRAPDSDANATVAAMTAFVRGCLDGLAEAPRASAREVLDAYEVALGIDRRAPRDLYARYRRCLASGYFEFSVPRTPMHGDFVPQNAIVHRERLYVFDWEYATDSGSLLYDAWFLRRSLVRPDARRDARTDGAVERYVDDLAAALPTVALRPDQFDAFGLAVHALVDFCRHERRGSDVAVLAQSLAEIERWVAEAPGG